jgi:AraC-like DNA-binding protein
MLDDIYLQPSRICYFRLAARRFGATTSQREVILEGTGIGATEIDDLHANVSFAQLMRLIDNMNELYGEGWFLGAPELWTMACFRPLGVAAVTAANLGAALDVAVQHIPAGLTQQRLNLVQQPSEAVLRHTLATAATVGEHKFLTASVFLGLSTILEAVLGPQKSSLSYEFIWSEPPYGADLEAALGGAVRWGAATNAMLVPRRLLGVRSPLADPVLHWAAVESLVEAKRRSMSEGLQERIERLLSRSESPRVRFDETARTLGLSQRTLTRRLFEQGVNYRALVDAELRHRARRWLDGGVMGHAEIAERLGFSELTSFNRACRRWFPRSTRPVGQVNGARMGTIVALRPVAQQAQASGV